MQMGVGAQPVDVRPQPAAEARPGRNGGLDALRAVMTLLVLFHHTAITYGASGGWFYHEVTPNGSLSSHLLTMFVATNQAYFMGLFFLLAGYFTPAAFRTKGSSAYLRDRLLRLGVPLLLFGLLIGPLTVALAGLASGHAFWPTLLTLWQRGRFIEGPLWFAEALLIFGVAAVPWLLLSQRSTAPQATAAPFPSNTTLAILAVLTGAAAFVLRLWWPVGRSWHGLQFGYFASYVVLFAAGCLAARPRWLERIPRRTARIWFGIALVSLPLLPLSAGVWPPGPTNSSDGGWTVPAAIYAFWEPLVAWGLILLLLVVFQRRYQHLVLRWQQLAARAYTIYIIHPPVLVGLALAWRNMTAPPLLKVAVTGIATCVACFLLAGLILRIPRIQKIL